jgi:c-di-GMP-binding flagellar brake protein YcgR
MEKRSGNARLDSRVVVRLKVLIFGTSEDHPELEMVTRDLSVGGMLCESTLPVPLGEMARLSLDLTRETGGVQPVALQAIPLRIGGNGPYTVAFHFVNAPRRVVDLIRKFVARTVGSQT